MSRWSTKLMRVVLATLLLAVAAPGQADDFLDRLDTAVLAGDGPALQALQAELTTEAAEPGEVYLWAYTSWRLAQRLPDSDKKRRKRLLRTVSERLQGLLEQQPDDAEAMALLGGVLGDRIEGMMSAIRLGKRASEVLEKAYELAPSNPRVGLLRGVGYSFSPKAFGGGKEKAEVELRRALELFAEQPPGQPWPNWGYRDALARLGETLVELERRDEAREVYQRALEAEPGFVWVRDELLPALASGT